VDKFYWLDQIKLQDRTKVGDQAFHLSKIMQRGYSVLPGFVVSCEVLQDFLESLNSSEALLADLPSSSLHLDVDNWQQLQQVATRLQQEIINANIPSHWVSSILEATKKWESKFLIFQPTFAISATQHTENVSLLFESLFCQNNLEAVSSALKGVWSQLFNARSLFYWQRYGINLQQINLAVLIQPAYNALCSGILNANPSGLEVQATWGLGLAIALGEVQPDVYYIQRDTGNIVQQLGNKMLAYRLDDGTTTSLPVSRSVFLANNADIIAYLIEDAEQQYALEEQQLQKLIELAIQLVNELGVKFKISFLITEKNQGKLYLTQVNSILSHHIIKGLGAARGRVVGKAHVVTNIQNIPSLAEKVILVAKAIAPDWLTVLQQVTGIITEQGGLTSHGAILARELGIPAIVNAEDATILIKDGEQLLIDGDQGEIYRLTDGQRSKSKVAQSQMKATHPQHLLPSSTQPIISGLPMIATQLLLNLSQSSLIEQMLSLPVDGVGLIRSELMVLTMLSGQHPNTWLTQGRRVQLQELWSQEIMQFAKAFAPRPVFYRSLDWRSHELPSHGNKLAAPQSILGERGSFSYLANPALFEVELAALQAVQQSGYTNLHLILPFVRSVEEFSFCYEKIKQAGLARISQFQIWIMAEVPSVLFLLPEYVKAGVQGISIGTNDLTQLILGVDREQGQLARLFDERHPAVMNAVAQLIRIANETGIPCSICGQAPALYPEIIQQLVRWGITAISVEPEAVSRTYQAIARAEQWIILEAARR
jgi:pyruvate,water dikinase